jgi:GPH family glycoside/pentoside/hexuronide:cation symporter
LSQSASTPPPLAVPVEDARLTRPRMAVYGLGDVTVNAVLTSLSFFYVLYFLPQEAGLDPRLAGWVQLVARFVDAFTDPMMGRISDRARFRTGRRRPFLLIGAVPFGLSFALLWVSLPVESQLVKFAYYTGVYTLLSISMTIVSIPYLSLQPEMATGYDARTGLNAFRNAGSVIGVLAAIGFRPLTNALGGGPAGWALGGVVFGIGIALPWFAIYAATWERPDFQARESRMSFLEGALLVAHHRSYRQLMGLYLCGRVSMDLVGAMMVLYFSYWIGRSGDFELAMLFFLLVVLAVLPFWVWVSRHTDKSRVFIGGSLWWICAQVAILFAEPDWPRWLMFLLPPLTGIGYAVVDLFPWAMLGEVVDEDDVATGERREGLYYGFFTFIRKLAGALAVWGASQILGWSGYVRGAEQTEATLTAIRLLTALGPALFITIGVFFAIGYPLTRRRHAEILAVLAARRPRS